VARLREQSGAGELSEPARTCMQSPLAIALARALCDDATDTADLLVADLVEAGLSVEEICLDHLAPAAKCLGEWWENDRLPFTEVAMATSRIQAILRRMPAGGRGRHRSFHRGAVFCAVPGEQHTLGVMMAADLFRRNGWDVGLLVGLDHAEILGRLERDDRCVIGLSCSGAHSLAALDRLMQALRGMRPDARLILSGQIVLDPAALARLPAPDAIVRSVAEAEAQIAQLDADLALGRLQRASVA
jgi:MerR family transcriptional regulator, light-induced transcriptional regulator